MTERDKLTIFYTDDDIEDLEIFRDITSELRENLEVYTMTSAEMLFRQLQNPPPVAQILFLDINMPGANGFDVLQKLRADEQFCKLPVVMFSTSDDPATIRRSRELGASYFLPKSSDFVTLKNSIAYAIALDWSTFDPGEHNFVYAKA